MSKISRNAPCPCGSGRKYKQCCLRKQQEQGRQNRAEDDGVSVALDWLQLYHRKAFARSLDTEFFGDPTGARRAEVHENAPIGYLEMIDINAHELMLAEAPIATPKGPARAAELLFGPGGPLLDAVQRQYLEKLCSRPLGLYEVIQVRPGEGFDLFDLLEPQKLPVWVAERAGSRSFSPGSVLAARLLPGEPWTLTGAIYSFRPDAVPKLLDDLRRALATCGDDWEEQRRARSGVLVKAFLDGLMAPPPSILDLATGEPILLSTAHYRILDCDRLAASLAQHEDVVFEPGQGWTRLEDAPGGISRVLCSLNLAGQDRLELFARTAELAEVGQSWLEDLAGPAVEYIIREVSDPLAAADHGPGDLELGSEKAPELAIEVLQGFYENQIYGDWTEVPIPALDGKTPRQAIRSKSGEQKVRDLLDSYRRNELKQASDQGRESVDFSFLWERLGLRP